MKLATSVDHSCMPKLALNTWTGFSTGGLNNSSLALARLHIFGFKVTLKISHKHLKCSSSPHWAGRSKVDVLKAGSLHLSGTLKKYLQLGMHIMCSIQYTRFSLSYPLWLVLTQIACLAAETSAIADKMVFYQARLSFTQKYLCVQAIRCGMRLCSS